MAFLLSAQEYHRLQTPQIGFWEACLKFRQQLDAEAIDLDPDEIFANVRDQSLGREVTIL